MTVKPEGPGHVLAALSMILLIIAWITVALRVVVRQKISAFGTDDWMMVIGLAFFTMACASTILCAYNGVGAHADRLNDYYNQQGRKWFMFFQLFYVASTVPIKASICFALLRITRRAVFRWPLYAVMVLATIAAIVCDVAILVQCKPISATWDKTAGTCAKAGVITGVSYLVSAVSILTDWTCAIMPVFILWDVQLRFRIKAPVAVVLALGVVASTATLVRLKYLLNYGSQDDYLYGIANIAVWSITESGTGIIAGSLATLRPLFKYIPGLRDIAKTTHSKSRSRTKNNKSALRQSHRMDGLRTGMMEQDGPGKGTWMDLSDNASQKYILKESHVTITHEGASPYEAGREAGSSESGSRSLDGKDNQWDRARPWGDQQV